MTKVIALALVVVAINLTIGSIQQLVAPAHAQTGVQYVKIVGVEMPDCGNIDQKACAVPVYVMKSMH